MPGPMPEAVLVCHVSRRVSPRRTGLRSARSTPRRLLRWLLLGLDGAVARGRRYERALDRPSRTARFLERVTSMGRVIARFAGIVLVVGGAWLFAMGTS